MAFRIERRARGKRGLFRRAPDPKELGDRLGRLARRMLKDDVGKAGWKKDRYVVELELHEAARVTLSVESDADVVLRSDTSLVGPALHAHAIDRVEPLLSELDVAWVDPFDFAAVQRATCEWFAGELRDGARELGVGREFHVD